MGLGEDVKRHQSMVRRADGESDERLAARLYAAQMEVYEANAGRDLKPFGTTHEEQFQKLDATTRASWVRIARRHDAVS